MDSISFQKKVAIAASVVALTTVASLIRYFLKKKQHPIALNPKQKIPFRLIEKEVISHDTRRFRFALQTPKHVLGLPIGNHLYLSAKIDGKLCIRPYTPTTLDNAIGHFDLVIKVYFKNTHPKFPDGGKMSQYLEAMNVGDSIDVRGPSGHICYKGNGNFTFQESGKEATDYKCKEIGMIAGGTGITPMLQIIQSVLDSGTDQTKMSLIFANQTEEDILVRERLEELEKKYPDQFSLWYTLDRPPTEWSYSSGFINEDIVRSHLPASSDHSIVLMCGPPPMIQYACIPNLTKVGYPESRCIAF